MSQEMPANEIFAERVKALGQYRDHLREMRDFAETLPEPERQGLHERIAKIADILTWEIEELRKWNYETARKH